MLRLRHYPSDRHTCSLRQAGWSEDALVETVLTVAWLNFINRVSTGLGLVAEI